MSKREAKKQADALTPTKPPVKKESDKAWEAWENLVGPVWTYLDRVSGEDVRLRSPSLNESWKDFFGVNWLISGPLNSGLLSVVDAGRLTSFWLGCPYYWESMICNGEEAALMPYFNLTTPYLMITSALAVACERRGWDSSALFEAAHLCCSIVLSRRVALSRYFFGNELDNKLKKAKIEELRRFQEEAVFRKANVLLDRLKATYRAEEQAAARQAAARPSKVDATKTFILEVLQDRPEAERREYLKAAAVLNAVTEKHPDYDRKRGTIERKLTALVKTGAIQSKPGSGYRLPQE